MGSLRCISLSLSSILLVLAHGVLTAHSPESPRLEPIPAQPGHGINTTLAMPRDINSAISPLAKRQYNCPSNCRYCCGDFTCINSPADVCCGGYFCNAGQTCSNSYSCCREGTKACHTGCIPDDAECCQSIGWCHPGQHCYRINGNRNVCCPAGGCYGDDYYEYTTRYSTEYTTATTTDEYTTTDYTTSTSTYLDWDYYSWTITWTYWVTFYTYYRPALTDIRTSTTTTTTTIVSVYATNTAEASSSFDEISATMTYTVPSTATDPPRPTTIETETPGLDASDPGIWGDDPTGFGGGDTSGGVIAGQPSVPSWYGLVMFVWMVIMPGVLARFQ